MTKLRSTLLDHSLSLGMFRLSIIEKGGEPFDEERPGVCLGTQDPGGFARASRPSMLMSRKVLFLARLAWGIPPSARVSMGGCLTPRNGAVDLAYRAVPVALARPKTRLQWRFPSGESRD